MTEALVVIRIDRNQQGRSNPAVPSADYLGFLDAGGGPYELKEERQVDGDNLDVALLDVLATSDGGTALVIEVASPSITEAELAAYSVMISRAIAHSELACLAISVPRVEDLVGCGRLHDLYKSGLDTYVLDETYCHEVHRGGALEQVGPGLPRVVREQAQLPRVQADDLCLRFGHFTAQIAELKLHCNTIPDIQGLSEKGFEQVWLRLVDSLDHDLRVATGGRPFALHPIDWFEGEMSALALKLCESLSRYIWYPGMAMPDAISVVVTLSSTALSRDVHQYLARKRRIPTDVELVNWNLLGNPTCDVAYSVEVSPIAGTFSPWSCPYCGQGVPIEGDGSDSRQMGPLHSKIFWDMVSWHASSLDHRHWKSPLTPNHFNLRLQTGPIFETFANCLALRILNSLELRGVKRSWIDGIVCTAGVESTSLVPELARLLGLDDDHIVTMDQAMRSLAQGPGNHPELRAAIDAQRDSGKQIFASNVIIVDQASHHLTTRSALRKVADYHEARTLAFAVFVDRAGLDEDGASELHEREHYVPLYSWACRPLSAGACSCGDLVELIS